MSNDLKTIIQVQYDADANSDLICAILRYTALSEGMVGNKTIPTMNTSAYLCRAVSRSPRRPPANCGDARRPVTYSCRESRTCVLTKARISCQDLQDDSCLPFLSTRSRMTQKSSISVWLGNKLMEWRGGPSRNR